MALFSTMEFCAYILPRPIEIRALLGAVSTEFCANQRHEIGPSSSTNQSALFDETLAYRVFKNACDARVQCGMAAVMAENSGRQISLLLMSGNVTHSSLYVAHCTAFPLVGVRSNFSSPNSYGNKMFKYVVNQWKQSIFKKRDKFCCVLKQINISQRTHF